MRKLRTIICTGLAFIVLALAHQHIGLLAAESRKCAAPAAVPADFASSWCQVAAQVRRGAAYLVIADELHGLRRYSEALRMYEAAGELGEREALANVGLYLLEGIHGETDKRRGIAALESAVRLGHRHAVAFLEMAYLGNFGAELRDPMMAAMWVFAREPILRDRLGDLPLTYAKDLGLSDADIQEVKRRLAEWIAKNKPVWRPDYDTPPPRDGTWRLSPVGPFDCAAALPSRRARTGSSRMRFLFRSFCVAFAVAATMAIAITIVPTLADIDKNKDSDFCVFVDGRPLKDGRHDCVIDPWRVAERFLFYFAVFGGALLGPFGVYIVASLIKGGIKAVFRRRAERARNLGGNLPY